MSIEAMKLALECMEDAIRAGDWKVDGACDPDYVFVCLRAAIEQAATPTEQEAIKLAAISTAAIGYFKDGDPIQPEYDTVALRDVTALYTKYEALHKQAEKP